MARLRRAPERLRSAPARLRPAPKVAAEVYRSAEWRALLARLIAQRGRRCEACGATGGRIYGDHKVELRDGGAPYDGANVQLLCAPCHGAKTERAKRERLGLA